MNHMRKIFLSCALAFSLVLGGCASIDTIDESYDSYVPLDKDYYLARFVDYDSSLLYQGYFTSEEMVVYKGNKPNRPNDDLYTYTFTGWDKELSYIKEDTTYTAQYSSRLLERYTVSFINYNGDELYTIEVKEGEDAYYVGETPTRPDDPDGTTYTFIGWNKDTRNIQSDSVFIATYSAKRQKLTVRFLNYDDSILDIQYAFPGEGVTYQGATPTRPDDGATTFTFKGWDKATSAIYEDTDVHVVYSESKRRVKVTYVNYDGSLLYTVTVDYGEAATYGGKTPTRKAEGRYEYTFSDWSVDTSAVYSDLVVTAEYTKQDRTATQGLVFTYREKWRYSNIEYTGYFVSGYNGTSTEVFIPKEFTATVEGKGDVKADVIGIDENAFSNNSTITSVFIEDNVKVICYGAFRYCSKLSSVRLSEGLEILYNEVFYQNNSLKSIEIPASVHTFDKNAFGNLPGNGCKITINKNNPYYVADTNGMVTDKEKTIIYFMFPTTKQFGTFTIPEGIKTIQDSAFNFNYTGSMNVKKIIFPSTLEKIGNSAFYSEYLEEIVFKDSPCAISNSAFSSCYKINKIDFGTKLVSIDDWAFNSSELKSVNLPASITKLSRYAFDNCGNLSSITIAEGCEKYRTSTAFVIDSTTNEIMVYLRNYSGKVVIDKGIKNIEWNRFNQCQYTSIEVAEDNPNYSSENNIIYSKDKTTLYSLRLPSTKTSIVSSDIASAVTTLGSYSIYNYSQLTTINLKDTNITTFKNYAIYCNYNLKTLVLPTALTTLSEYSLAANQALTKLEIPKGPTTIPSNCCQELYNLTTLSIPEGVESINYYAFANCSSLKTVTLPSTLTSLGGYAFGWCNALTKIELPDGFTSLGYNAFQGCEKLASATIPGTLTNYDSNPFSDCQALTTVTFGEGITDFNNNSNRMFSSCPALTTVNFPSTLTHLNSRFFYNCSKLSYLILPAAFEDFTGNNAEFSQCAKLKTLYLLGDVPEGGFYVTGMTTYLYSETEKVGYWHYNESGKPTVWKAS